MLRGCGQPVFRPDHTSSFYQQGGVRSAIGAVVCLDFQTIHGQKYFAAPFPNQEARGFILIQTRIDRPAPDSLAYIGKRFDCGRSLAHLDDR